MTDGIDVKLDLLEHFADQLERRLEFLEQAAEIPGFGRPLPVAGAPAYEGQLLSDAYWNAAHIARDMLDVVKAALHEAAHRTQATRATYSRDDVDAAERVHRLIWTMKEPLR